MMMFCDRVSITFSAFESSRTDPGYTKGRGGRLAMNNKSLESTLGLPGHEVDSTPLKLGHDEELEIINFSPHIKTLPKTKQDTLSERVSFGPGPTLSDPSSMATLDSKAQRNAS